MLAEAKSKELIYTLLSEALCSNKTWDEIKDSLHLKICKSDIHTSISHYMEIQQKEKKSLAAYIHRFKREANRCNFINNAAMIWIFINGLRNAHTLATQVYEKEPQNLADAIKEVERLQAAQQLTATLLPSSTVNVMSSEDDKFFSVSRIRAHGMPLSPYKMFQLQLIWSCHSRLSRQNTTIRYTCMTQKTSL